MLAKIMAATMGFLTEPKPDQVPLLFVCIVFFILLFLPSRRRG